MVEKSDLLLQALDATALDDKATAVKVEKFMFTDGLKNKDWLGYWFNVMKTENIQTILKMEVGNMSPEKEKEWEELLETVGLAKGFREKGRREGRQEGLREGVQEFVALLKSGYSVDEAQEKLLQNA